MISNAVQPQRRGRAAGEGGQRLLHAAKCPLREVRGVGVIAGEPAQEGINPFIKTFDQLDHRRLFIVADQGLQLIRIQIRFDLICLVEWGRGSGQKYF